MKTKIYKPISTVNNEYAIVDFKNGSRKISDFFIYDKGDGEFLNYTKPTAFAQHGFTEENIYQSDFIQATISIPIFSTQFKQKLEKSLSDEIAFFECDVVVDEKKHKFYIGKLLKSVDLIDEEKSQYRKLSDGEMILSKLAYKEKFDESFYIARDTENVFVYEVTDAFAELVKNENLKIDFYERF